MGSAFGSLWLVLPAWLVVVSIGGLVPAWVHENDRDLDPSMLLMWIVELGMSALTIVGLVPIVLHWWFLRSMLDGQEVCWNLWRGFVTQVLTGSLVLGIELDGEMEPRMGVLATGMIAVAVVVFRVRRMRLKRLEGEWEPLG